VTIRTNARVAGVTFLVYIAAGIAPMAQPLGPLAHVVSQLLQCFSALTLAATLYAITKGEDEDLARFAMMCRVGEGVLGATTGTNVDIGATFFAVGSTIFAYLLLRGRIIPTVLGWIGVAASLLLVVCLPAHAAGLLPKPLGMGMWLPMLVFEVSLALLWIVRPPR